MKPTRHFAFLSLVAAAIGVVALLLFSPAKAVPTVTVAFVGTTNDSLGNILNCFQVTNSMAEDTHGCYAVEIFHSGVWFNALPQPKGADQLTYLPAGSAGYFTVAAPTGRAEQGLRIQPDPPGEKWRAYFSYTARRYPRNVFGLFMERVSKSVGGGSGQEGRYAFSPEISFEPTKQPKQPALR